MTNLKTIPILVTHACERLSSLGIFGKHESVEISNRKRENGLVQNVRFDGGNIKAPTAREGQKHQPLFLLQVEARVTTSFRDDLVASWRVLDNIETYFQKCIEPTPKKHISLRTFPTDSFDTPGDMERERLTDCLAPPDPPKKPPCAGKKHVWADLWASPLGRTHPFFCVCVRSRSQRS